MNEADSKAAYDAAERDERSEMHRLIGAVRFLATSEMHRHDLHSRLIDALYVYDLARARTSAALEATKAEVRAWLDDRAKTRSPK